MAEIQNQTLTISPGLIEVGGILEDAAGNTLRAALERNGLPFNDWADPTTLESVVAADGSFTFAIRANPDRTGSDLFALDAADYQIVITGQTAETPLEVSIYFSTSATDVEATPAPAEATPAPAEATTTATSSPTPVAATATLAPATPTAVAQATVVPPTSRSPINTPSVIVDTVESDEGDLPSRVMLAGGLILASLLIIGLIVWLIFYNKNK